MRFEKPFFFLISFCLVAFGQNAWAGWLGPLAATLGFALFWRSILGQEGKTRFCLALLWYAGVAAVQLSWMATTDYMGPLILAVYGCLLTLLGLQFALLSWLIKEPLTWQRSAALAGGWVILEWVRLFFLTGFTWNPVGLALATTTASLQMASVFGIYGLSFWVIFVNCMALRAMTLRTRFAISTWMACAILPFAFGAIRLSAGPTHLQTSSVWLVQTTLLPEERDFDPKFPEKHISPFLQWDHLLQSISRAKGKPDLIVLPEGALPFDAFRCVYPYFDVQRTWMRHFGIGSQIDLPPLGDPVGKPLSSVSRRGEFSRWGVSNAYWVQALANHFNCEVVVGMDDSDASVGKHYNAAFHFVPHRNSAVRTEKRVLVPVGEYVPLKNWRFFSEFVSKEFGIEDSFDPGSEPTIFNGRIPIGVSICYEETYSALIRELYKKGAQILVNISNDVWFPHSRLARQHFDHGRVRAVENGLPVIRACNAGVTGGVDCFGRILGLQNEMQHSTYFIEVPIQTCRTLYSFWGDWAVLAASAIFCIVPFRRRVFSCLK